MGIFAKKYQLILILSFIAGIMVILKLFYEPEIPVTTNKIIQINPTIVPTIIAIPTEPTATDSSQEASQSASWEKEADKLMPLWRLLPYQGEGFVVESYIDEETIVVTLKNKTKSEVLVAVKAWINKNGVDAEKQKIEWR